MPLSVAYTPCPNDTFLFYGWVHGFTGSELPIVPVMADVQHLNEWALEQRHPVSKVSVSCLGKILDNYCLLPAGAALGRGCGPKIISTKPMGLEGLKKTSIAIPGKETTANLLLHCLVDIPKTIRYCTYNEVIPLMKEGAVDAGLIIHETRFTYKNEGFYEVTDLGALWEHRFRLPIPLGGIVAHRSLGVEKHRLITRLIQASLSIAQKDPERCLPYLLAHSQEKSKEVVQSHVDLYITDETYSLSQEGVKGIDFLLSEGRKRGILPPSNKHWLMEGR